MMSGYPVRQFYSKITTFGKKVIVNLVIIYFVREGYIYVQRKQRKTENYNQRVFKFELSPAVVVRRVT